ncbi:uncharacterized protein G2W53_010319 [Senna tora]|uniref:Uncharacterized protein n=1 Tax=Senna tora TaxID=362788 RepID=A0A834WZ19_9FABA|nr:uncharacterized protein G2W53_010319 [Senna tora]
MGGAWIMSQHISDDKSRSDLRNLHELRGKRLVAQVSQTRRFALYLRTGVVLMLQLESSPHGRSVDHDSTYPGRQIAVGSQKPSRITRQKTCWASESTHVGSRCTCEPEWFWCSNWSRLGMGGAGIMSQHIPDVRSRSDLRNLHELRAKDLLRKVVLMLQLESSLHGRSVDHVSTYSGRQTAVGSQQPSRITRQKTVCASESNTSVRVVLANRSGFGCSNWSRPGMGGAWIMSQHILDDKSRSGSQKPSRITRQKTCCASESTPSFALYLRTGVVLMLPIGSRLRMGGAWISLNIFRTTNRGWISENLHELRGKRLVAEVSQTRRRLRMGGAWIMSQHIPDDKSRSDLRNLHELRGKRLVAQVSQQTSVRTVLANRSGFDAPIGVVSAWEERGSCLNIFRTTNRRSDLRNLHELRGKRLVAQVSQHIVVRVVLANRSGFDAPIGVVSAWEESVDHVSTYSGRQIAVGSQKPSRITRQKTCCASESNTSVRVVLANRSGLDAPIGVVLAWEERGSCLNIFWTTNRGRISETFTNYEAKDLMRSESIHVVRVVLANRSGFDAPIGVVSAWEERGSCLNIFRTTNRGRISETLTNYEAKGLLRKQKTCCAVSQPTSVRVGTCEPEWFDAPIGVVLAWEERASCPQHIGKTNRGRISETFTNYEAKDLLLK